MPPATTFPDFGDETDALDVARAFGGSIAGRYIVVTGVNLLGIGYSTAAALASQSPACLVLCGRDVEHKVGPCVDELRRRYPGVTYKALQLDLSSQRAVRAAAERLLAWEDVPRIDILVNNAGVMNLPDRQLSPEGIELQFATNYVGHFLFTNLIVKRIIAAAESSPSSLSGVTRIVNVGSQAMVYSPVRFSDPNCTAQNGDLPPAEQPAYETFTKNHPATTDLREKSYVPMVAYGQSKTALVLFGMGLTSRLYDKYKTLGVSVDPGGILTEITRHTDPEKLKAAMEKWKASGIVFKTLEQGASTTLVAACDPKLAPTVEGETTAAADKPCVFLADCQIGTPPVWATDPNSAERLWKLGEELVGETFDY
jgi:NAD(P)-dependent dehydrogenase (short-subunit alcohol dehydrogenase family)